MNTLQDNFYDRWVDAEARVRQAHSASPVIIRDEETPWIETRMDVRAKLLCADELGLPTMGGVVVKAEIPVGWQSGRHAHGEESIFVLEGDGASLIAGEWFRWRAGAALHIPYRAEHQHFNLGDLPAVYLSAMSTPLEEFVNLGGVDHIADCGPLDGATRRSIPAAGGEYLASGRRVMVHADEAPTDPGDDPINNLPANRNQHGDERFLINPRSGFEGAGVAVSHLFTEPAGFRGGRHRHLEAVLYVVSGSGYTEVEDRVYRWQPGDLMHIPPAMYSHQHYNDGNSACELLRIQFGIRNWFTSQWPEGYQTRRDHDEQGRPITAGEIDHAVV